MQEYPKAIYKGGDTSGECRVVFDSAEESTLSKEGFAPVGQEIAAEPAKRRGRPPKIVAEGVDQ
jgi:hypothetical protein